MRSQRGPQERPVGWSAPTCRQTEQPRRHTERSTGRGEEHGPPCLNLRGSILPLNPTAPTRSTQGEANAGAAAARISVKIAPHSADNTGKQHLALKSLTVEETMRRSALFLLALHLAAHAAFAQTAPPARPAQAVAPPPEPASPLLQPVAQPAAPVGGIEVRAGERAPTYMAGKDAPPEQRPAPPLREALLTFDPQRADVVWSQNHWQLVVDGQVLKDFGRREVEARVALRVLRDLHLTQHGAIGSP